MTSPEKKLSSPIWHLYQGHIYKEGHLISDLTPLQRSIQIFLINHPWVHLSKSELIDACWPDDVCGAVSDEALQKMISDLRCKIGDRERKYIRTWRGQPEGGYLFYPNGRPPQYEELPPSSFTPPLSASAKAKAQSEASICDLCGGLKREKHHSTFKINRV